MRWPWRKRHHGLSCKAVDYHAAMLEERCQHQVVVITQLYSQVSNLHAELARLGRQVGSQPDESKVINCTSSPATDAGEVINSTS